MQSDLVIDALVLTTVLGSDLGSERKIGPFRLVRPLLIAGALIPLYLKGVSTTGTGLALEIGLAAAGIVLGLAASALMTVYRSPRTGRPVSRATWAYAALWTVVIGARAAFSYGAHHWFGPQLSHWMTVHAVSAGAITDALIFMAVTMLLFRTLGLAARTLTLGPDTALVEGRRSEPPVHVAA